ncbi:FAD-binding oxidoreductase [Metabacillus sp. HB246100]
MFQALEKSLENRVILPGTDLYEEKRKVWNGAFDKYPGAIISCETEDDVIKAVNFAQEKDLHIAVRGGGHHIGGFATCDGGVLIDLSNMKNVVVDEERMVAVVEGGATLADIDAETQKYGLATPTGTVSETGIAGLALSGGLGYLRGKYGLTCDNLVGAHVVTTDGQLLSVSQTEHEDLFWAIRGGGGNFGIVTKFEFQLYQVGPEVLALDVIYDQKDAKQILQKAQRYIATAPDEISFNITMAELPPAPFLPEFLHHKKVVMVGGMYAGDPEVGKACIKPLQELATPIVDQTGVMPYVALQKKLDAMVPTQIPVYGTSLYFASLEEEMINTLLEKLESAPAPTSLVQLWGLSGQMNQVPVHDTAFSNRDSSFVLLLDLMDMGFGQEICEQWVNSVYDVLFPFSNKGASYLNGIGENEQAVKNTLAENYERLLICKKKYDPNNRLRHNHNISPK